jgi:photosystem II stability/assembly factor-like uncharacterized protein
MRSTDRSTNDDAQYFASISPYLAQGKKIPRALRRPHEWFYKQRAYPDVSIPAGKPLEAVQAARAMYAQAAQKVNAATPVWTMVGPTNIPGRVVDIEAHPTNPAIIYVASASGGIFKSTNSGSTWNPTFDMAGTASMGDLAIDPQNPDVLYAGTGEANGAGSTFDGTGIWKSTDAGITWAFSGLPNSYRIGRVVVDAHRPDTVFAAVNGQLFGSNPERGVYRTTDGGLTWQQKFFVADSAGCVDLVYDPGTQTLIAAFWERIRDPARRKIGGVYSQVYRSTDAGDTWTSGASLGLPANSPSLGRIGLAMDTVTSTVYALYSDDQGNYTGLYKSTTNGLFWFNTFATGLNNLNASWGGGWYFSQISVTPGKPDTVYAMGLELHRSTDGGINFSSINGPMHVDQHALYVAPTNPNLIIAGNDGGVYLSNNAGGGGSFTGPFLLPNMQFYAVTIDPSNPLAVYGGAQDNGTNRTLTSNPDTWDHILGADGFYVIVDYTDPNVIYAEYQNGWVLKSTSQGAGWSSSMTGIDYNNERHEWSTPIVMDPNNNLVLYYGSNFLYKTTNGAANWSKISGDLTGGPYPGNLGLGTISTIDVARTDGDVIYVGTDDAKVWVTTDGGTSWTEISAGLPNRWVTRVTADPQDAGTVYVTLSGYKEGSTAAHMYRSTNFGSSWTSIQGDFPDAAVNDILVDPTVSGTLYIGSDVGVYISEDLGTTWTPLGTGLPIVPVLDIHIDPSRPTQPY